MNFPICTYSVINPGLIFKLLVYFGLCIIFLWHMFIKCISQLFSQLLTVSFNIILFLQALQTYFIYPNLQPFSFYSSPLYFLPGIFTLICLYSLIFLLLLWSGYFTPYRCLFLTLYFSSTLDHFFWSSYIHCQMKYLHLSFNTFHFLSTSLLH